MWEARMVLCSGEDVSVESIQSGVAIECEFESFHWSEAVFGGLVNLRQRRLLESDVIVDSAKYVPCECRRENERYTNVFDELADLIFGGLVPIRADDAVRLGFILEELAEKEFDIRIGGVVDKVFQRDRVTLEVAVDVLLHTAGNEETEGDFCIVFKKGEECDDERFDLVAVHAFIEAIDDNEPRAFDNQGRRGDRGLEGFENQAPHANCKKV